MTEITNETLTKIVQEQDTEKKESVLLQLNIDKVRQLLNWIPIWDFETAMINTVVWYKAFDEGENMREFSINQIKDYYKG